MKNKSSLIGVIFGLVCFGAACFGQASLPVAPAQPANVAAYSPAALDLFTVYTRASYLAAFGAQAPAFDATKPVRTWFDTSASPGPYQVVSGTSIVPLPVPAGVNVPNLAGAYQYPVYANLPSTTPAQLVLSTTLPPQPVPVSEICSQGDGQAVAASFGFGAVLGEDSADTATQWGAETRRRWTVQPAGGPVLEACPLRAEMTAQIFDPNGNYVSGGLGSPGSWSKATTPNPTWVPATDPGLLASGVPVAAPVRSLLPNEQLITGVLGAVEVARTDLPGAGGGAGALTSAQQTFLYQVAAALNRIYNLGVAVPAN